TRKPAVDRRHADCRRSGRTGDLRRRHRDHHVSWRPARRCRRAVWRRRVVQGADQRGGRRHRLPVPALSSAAAGSGGRGIAPHPPRPRAAIPARRLSRMSNQRRPVAFRLDDPHVVIQEADEPPVRPQSRGNRATVLVTPEPDASALPVPVDAPRVRRRRLPWSTLFWSCLGGLISFGFGLAVTRLIEDLFARSQALGAIALALAMLAGIALLAIVGREALGL